jgi:hypothetical protein
LEQTRSSCLPPTEYDGVQQQQQQQQQQQNLLQLPINYMG